MIEYDKMYDEVTEELDDNLVVKSLNTAMSYFLDGAILECRDQLANIVMALDDFTRDH